MTSLHRTIGLRVAQPLAQYIQVIIVLFFFNLLSNSACLSFFTGKKVPSLI